MIVVDTNIIAYLHINGKFTPSALQLLETDPYWIAPALWQSEFRNVLVNYVRHKVLSLAEAASLMEQAVSTMQNRQLIPSDELVLSLAINSTCSSYDCEFVALAQEINCRLVTVDGQIIRNFPDTAIIMDEFIKGLQ